MADPIAGPGPDGLLPPDYGPGKAPVHDLHKDGYVPPPDRDPVESARTLTTIATLALMADIGIYLVTLYPLRAAFGVPEHSLRHPGMLPALAIQYGIRVAAGILFVVYLCWKRQATLEELGLSFRNFGSDCKWTLKVISSLVGITLVLMAIGVAAVRVLGWRPDLGEDLQQWPVALLCAPLAEEFVYRSLVVPGLLAGYNRRETIIVSGVIFYFLHLGYGYHWYQFHYIVAGMLLSWVFVTRRRLWICALLHFGGNVLVMGDDLLLRYWPAAYKAILGYLPGQH